VTETRGKSFFRVWNKDNGSALKKLLNMLKRNLKKLATPYKNILWFSIAKMTTTGNKKPP